MKRMLAYSSIAQAGYLLIGVATGSLEGAEAVIYYLLVYGVMTMAAFAVVIIREREVEDGDEISALTGYGRARPVLGVVMTLSMLSLAGFPPLAGFVGKFLLFGSAVDVGMTWLAIVGAVGSMISLGYYLRVVTVTWSPEPEGGVRKVLAVPGPVGLATVASGLGVIVLAIMASPAPRGLPRGGRGAARALAVAGGVRRGPASSDLDDVAPAVGPGAVDVGEAVLLGEPAAGERAAVPAGDARGRRRARRPRGRRSAGVSEMREVRAGPSASRQVSSVTPKASSIISERSQPGRERDGGPAVRAELVRLGERQPDDGGLGEVVEGRDAVVGRVVLGACRRSSRPPARRAARISSGSAWWLVMRWVSTARRSSRRPFVEVVLPDRRVPLEELLAAPDVVDEHVEPAAARRRCARTSARDLRRARDGRRHGDARRRRPRSPARRSPRWSPGGRTPSAAPAWLRPVQ